MRDVLIVFLVILYNLTIIGATGYVVFGLGYSGWWFLLTLCFFLVANLKPKADS